jgi:DNA-directed RNA polymerase I subunit RPA49
MLGVLDKRTGNFSVSRLAGDRLLRMEPRVRSLNYATSTVSPSKEAEAAERREHNARLVEEFGSQRRKRQLATSRAAQVDAGQVSAGVDVLGMIASAGEGSGTREEVLRRALAHRNIPPHNADATTAEDAYPWNLLIPSSIADALEIGKIFAAERAAEYREELQRSGMFGENYVLSRISTLRQTDDKAAREMRARALCMLGHLLKLYVGRTGGIIKVRQDGGIKASANRLRMETSVLEGLLEIFYLREQNDEGGQRYILSKEKRLLLFGWILALALRAEPQCVLEPEAFQSLLAELKCKHQDAVQHYRELGCTILRASQAAGWRVVLLPAGSQGKTLGQSFPELKLGGRKPGGR